MKLSMAALAAVGAICATAPAQALTILINDNFNADPLQGGTKLNPWVGDSSFHNVSVIGALVTGSATNHQVSSVDLIGNNFHLCSPNVASNHCLDLDGSSGFGNPVAGEIASNATYTAGTYHLTFDLRGNGRNKPGTSIPSPGQTTIIKLGNWSTAIALPQSAAWSTYSFAINTTGGALQFIEQGPSTQNGNVLDNVYLTTPEPASWAVMLLGMGSVGFALRRRAKVAAA